MSDEPKGQAIVTVHTEANGHCVLDSHACYAVYGDKCDIVTILVPQGQGKPLSEGLAEAFASLSEETEVVDLRREEDR